MEKKNLRIITPKDLSFTIKNASADMTFYKLKQITELLVSTESLGLFYNDIEIIINDTNISISELFKKQNDITIEIKPRPVPVLNQINHLTTFKSIENHLNNQNFKEIYSQCNVHPVESLTFYCVSCSQTICFRCFLEVDHIGHKIHSLIEHFSNQYTEINYIIKSTKYEDRKNEVDSFENYNRLLVDTEFDKLIERLNNLRANYHEYFRKFFLNFKDECQKIQNIENQISISVEEIEREISLKSDEYNSTLNKFESLKVLFESLNTINLDSYRHMSEEMSKNVTYQLKKISEPINYLENDLFDHQIVKAEKRITRENQEKRDLNKYLQEITLGFNKPNESFCIKKLCIPIPLSNKLMTFNWETKEFLIDSINNKTFIFLDFCRYISVSNYLFINGGVLNNEDNSTSFIYNTEGCNLIRTTDLVNSRSQHSLLFLEPNLIFALGGKNNRSTEFYDLDSNKWFEFKPLNRPRYNANSLIFNNYLFVFGGVDQDSYLSDSFERILISSFKSDLNIIKQNLNSINLEFESGNFKAPEGCFLLTGSALLKIDSKLLIIGGYCSEDEEFISDLVKVGSFNENENNFTFELKTNGLVAPSCFFNQHFVNLGENILAQFNARSNVIVYDSSKEEFSEIKNNIII